MIGWYTVTLNSILPSLGDTFSVWSVRWDLLIWVLGPKSSWCLFLKLFDIQNSQSVSPIFVLLSYIFFLTPDMLPATTTAINWVKPVKPTKQFIFFVLCSFYLYITTTSQLNLVLWYFTNRKACRIIILDYLYKRH